MPNRVIAQHFPLPDNWSVEDTVCVKFRIPDDPQYLDVLIGLLDNLKQSKSFQRDATHSGAAEVARTWSAALETTPIELTDCEAVVDLRAKPGEPWIMQATTDGEEWHDALDTCACPTEPLFPPTFADEAEAAIAAGGMIRTFQEHVVQHMLDCIAESVSKAECVDSMMSELTPYGAGGAVRATLGNIWEQVSASADPDQYATDCPYLPCYDELSTYLGANLGSWLDGLSAFLFDWLDCSADSLIVALNQAAAQLGGNGFYNVWQAGGGGGGGFTEPFGGNSDGDVHEFDFSIDQQGFTIGNRDCSLPDCADAGRYAGGAFAAAWYPTVPLSVCTVISPPVDPSEVVKLVYVGYVIPTYSAGQLIEILIANGDDLVATIPVPNVEGTNVFSWNGALNFTTIALVSENAANVEFYWTECRIQTACGDPY